MRPRLFFPADLRRSTRGRRVHVLIAGGSPGKSGSALLAARGALRAGSGLVTLLWDRSFGEPALTLPEVMGLPVDFRNISPEEWMGTVSRMDAVACGPGVEERFGGRMLVESLFRDYPGPLVGDAGVFDLFAGRADEIAALRRGPLVLTPHPGEMGRLLGRETPGSSLTRSILSGKLPSGRGPSSSSKGLELMWPIPTEGLPST
jgi:Predicted sugar kinase